MDNINKNLQSILEEMKYFKSIVKNMTPSIKSSDIKKTLLKNKVTKDHLRHSILKKARKKAHTMLANTKRNISNNLKGYK